MKCISKRDDWQTYLFKSYQKVRLLYNTCAARQPSNRQKQTTAIDIGLRDDKTCIKCNKAQSRTKEKWQTLMSKISILHKTPIKTWISWMKNFTWNRGIRLSWVKWVSECSSLSVLYYTCWARKLHVNIMVIIPSTSNSFPEFFHCISWPTMYLEATSSLVVGVCVTVVARLTLQRVAGEMCGGGESVWQSMGLLEKQNAADGEWVNAWVDLYSA